MPPDVAAQLARLRADYLTRLPGELAALRDLADRLAVGDLDRAGIGELHHRLHKLAGSGGTFGLAGLSARARALEVRAKDWLQAPAPDAATRAAFAAEVGALAAGAGEAAAASPVPAWSPSPTRPHERAAQVWLVEDDPLLGRGLKRQLESFNYQVRLFPCLADAEQVARDACPDLMILDVTLNEEGEDADTRLALLPRLRALHCSLLFISTVNDFHARVRAAQLGALGYFLKPLDVPRLVNRMEQIRNQQRAAPQRVLIVDDDRDLAEHYRLVLLGAGMEAEVLDQPEAIVERISVFRPELVLMDLHMPAFSGPDLAGVIRQHDKWTGLPIVYLSAETDLELQVAALNRGADDFLIKPLSDAQLVSAVRARVGRARQLDELVSKDSLTGLLKHASIKEAAEAETARARRIGKPVTLAMLDIDHFKTVNDSYGHAAGDLVISSLAVLLRQRLRKSDVIGRYGGEEFVAVLPECDAAHAQALLDDIRQRFAALRFSHEGREFGRTLSVGLACSAHHPDATGAELLIAADEALYAAKRGGRDQVRAAPAPTLLTP